MKQWYRRMSCFITKNSLSKFLFIEVPVPGHGNERPWIGVRDIIEFRISTSAHIGQLFTLDLHYVLAFPKVTKVKGLNIDFVHHVLFYFIILLNWKSIQTKRNQN